MLVDIANDPATDDRHSAASTASRYEALVRVSEALRGDHDRDSLFRSLARELRPVLRFGFLALGLYGEQSHRLDMRVLAATGDPLPPPELSPEESLTYWIVQHQTPLVIPNVENEARFPKAMAYIRGHGVRATCSLPLTTPRRRLGMLMAGDSELHAYDTEDLTFLSLVANQVTLAIDDALTCGESERSLRAEGERRQRLEVSDEPSRALATKTGRVVGPSPEWQAVLEAATRVALTDTTVLLVGESGTGKEVVARFIHHVSNRANGPFVALNCAALPEQLLESELFGYERGAFTGAQQAKPGQIELAAGGVLFLDEVAEMSPSAQAKFLRVLQEREFQRLGSTRTLKARARVIAATNRDLNKAMERGEFREDLFYRLQVFDITLPALRERTSDILPLSEAFLQEIGQRVGRPPAGLARDAKNALLRYHWPGNVRQLHNALERAAILCDGGLITADHLSLDREPSVSPPPCGSLPATDLSSVERDLIVQALAECGGNKSKAAARLGISRTQLYVRMRKHQLS